jgi:hypothetical protein
MWSRDPFIVLVPRTFSDLRSQYSLRPFAYNLHSNSPRVSQSYHKIFIVGLGYYCWLSLACSRAEAYIHINTLHLGVDPPKPVEVKGSDRR